MFDKPLQDFAVLDPLSGWQSFSNNPSSSTTWDYFKYAIGPDAVAAFPAPEPAASLFIGLGLTVLAVFAGRDKRRV